MTQEEIVWLSRVFKKTALLKDLTVAETERLMEEMEPIRFPKDQAIVHQGEVGDSFFIIYQGRVKVIYSKWFFKKVEVSTLEPGDFFGEIALLKARRRRATVVALEDTTCFVLFKSTFQKLVDKNFTFKGRLRLLAKRRTWELERI